MSTGPHPRCAAESASQSRRPPSAERTEAKATAAQEEEEQRPAGNPSGEAGSGWERWGDGEAQEGGVGRRMGARVGGTVESVGAADGEGESHEADLRGEADPREIRAEADPREADPRDFVLFRW